MEEVYPWMIRRIEIDKNYRLTLAGRYGFSRLVKYLIPDCNVESLRQTIIESATFGHLKPIQVLLDFDIDLTTLRRGLEIAVTHGYFELVKYLIEEIHVPDNGLIPYTHRVDILKYLLKLETPTRGALFYLVGNRAFSEVVRYLLKSYSWSQTDLNTAVIKAFSSYTSNTEMAHMLIQNGAQVNSELLKQPMFEEMLDLLNDHIE